MKRKSLVGRNYPDNLPASSVLVIKFDMALSAKANQV